MGSILVPEAPNLIVFCTFLRNYSKSESKEMHWNLFYNLETLYLPFLLGNLSN